MGGDRLAAWGEELREVHRKLRQALAIARESIEDGVPNGRLSEDLLVYCRGFCAALSGHHESENRSLFPRVVRARPDLKPVIEKLSQDHDAIDDLIGGLEHALESGASVEEALRRLDGVEAIMETHFRYEERQLIDVLNAGVVDDADKIELFGPIA
ncbi:MAG: hemerythrin domain-containing protein [Stackebrandtia sp.]